MTMFHIKYPVSQTFFTWDEMGCLCRALGFQATMIQVQQQAHAYEIPYDEKGVSMKNIQRMFELNILYKVLHRTFNMHTADWNCCVISKALYLLSHKALSFEELHNIRVAYLTYEHIDMKGMPLVKHTMLRTLKMCGRTIAPLKLMHRLKHMKGQFEEKGRIQLYEFFDLILWCDVYTAFKPEDVETSSGKEDELFRLVDFKQLLSHHDQRMSSRLDQAYLQEEWDFGRESLGPRTLFHEPVVSTDARIAQVQFHKKNYQGLKTEVTQAQRRVYRAHAGSIRPRPISAPDVDKYRRVRETTSPTRSTAQEAYETVQKRLHSAPSRTSTTRSIDRPSLPEHVRVQTPSVVSTTDMHDVQLKIENLDFDMNTLDVRCQLQVEKEMEFYIPDYPEKLANRKTEPEPVPEPDRKRIHWTSKIINNLAYPASNLKPAHAKNCDARFRGWAKVSRKPGYHTVLTSQSHESSYKSRLFAKMEQTAMEPVQYLHADYVVRHTPKHPSLANQHLLLLPSGAKSRKCITTKPSGDLKSILSHRTGDRENAEEAMATRYGDVGGGGGEDENQQPKVDLEFFHNKYLNKDGDSNLKTGVTGSEDEGERSYPRGQAAKEDARAAKSTNPHEQWSSSNSNPSPQHKGPPDAKMTAEDLPVPHMQHSKPKIVGVGQIGTISLLESIQESRDLEEELDEQTSPSEPPLCTIDLPSDSTEPGMSPDDNIEDAEKLNKMLQLNLREQKVKKGQAPSSEKKREAIKSRQSRSAPSFRRLRSSPRKESPRKSQRAGKPSSGSSGSTVRRASSAGNEKSRSVSQKGDSKTSSVGDQSRMSSANNNNNNNSRSQVSSAATTNSELPFSGLRGSVTSDEMEKVISDFNKSDDVSVYSDAMTIASSVGLTELASPPLRRVGEGVGVSGLPDIRLEEEDDEKGRSFQAGFMDWQHGHRVQFHVMQEMRKTESPRGLLLSPLDASGRPNLQTSMSEREGLDFLNANSNYHDDGLKIHLSESDLTTSSSSKKFSKETRSRLVGRVEDAISPALKMMLMAEARPVAMS